MTKQMNFGSWCGFMLMMLSVGVLLLLFSGILHAAVVVRTTPSTVVRVPAATTAVKVYPNGYYRGYYYKGGKYYKGGTYHGSTVYRNGNVYHRSVYR